MQKADSSMATIARKLDKVPSGTPRHRALKAAHTFKASWVMLGEALLAVRDNDAYKAWGYDNFAQYCRHELHIREETARKLVRSYGFLHTHAPKTLARCRDDEAASPSLDVVDLLRQARARTQIDEAAWNAVQQHALEGDEGHVGRRQVMDRLREADPITFVAKSPASTPTSTDVDERPQAEAHAAGPIDPTHARKVLLLAERLYALLEAAPSLAGETDRAHVLALARQLRRHARLPKDAHNAHETATAGKLYSEGALH